MLSTAPTSSALVSSSVNRGTEAAQHGLVEAMAAGPDTDQVGGDAHEQPRDRGLAVAFPEPEVEVVLVGALVGAEADVAVDAEDRPRHPGLRLDARDDGGKGRGDGVHERLGR